MERCPICHRYTAERCIYTGKLSCYHRMCNYRERDGKEGTMSDDKTKEETFDLFRDITESFYAPLSNKRSKDNEAKIKELEERVETLEDLIAGLFMSEVNCEDASPILRGACYHCNEVNLTNADQCSRCGRKLC